MKLTALFLYAIALFLALAIDGVEGLIYWFPLLALLVTLLLGVSAAFLALYNATKMSRGAPKEDPDKRWIL